MITGIIRTEESSDYFKEVVWTFHDFGERIEKEGILLSDIISLGQEKWRILLYTLDILGSRYISISLSRFALSGNGWNFPFTFWHAGILGSDGFWKCDRSSLVEENHTSNEWKTIADWSGPECTYMNEERDLYMPYGRLRFVLQFHWNPMCYPKDSLGSKVDRIADSLNREEYDRHTKTAFWIIEDPGRLLEKSKTLRSDTFSFGSQLWHLSLNNAMDTSQCNYCPNAVLSRVMFASSYLLPFVYTSRFSSIFWRGGFLAIDGKWEFYNSGVTELRTLSEKVIVADSSVPRYRTIWLDKDQYVPPDHLKFVVELGWTSKSLLPSNKVLQLTKALPSSGINQVLEDDSSNEESYSIILKVKETTFHIHRTILEMYCPMLHVIASSDDNPEFLHLPDCEPRIFEAFLYFAYFGDIDGLEGADLEELYYFADIYDILELKKECISRLLETMNPESVCRILDLAQKHGEDELESKAVEFVKTNAREVFCSDAWLQFMVTHTIFARDLILQIYDKQNMPDRLDS